jgi:hypothetical protein
MWDLSCPAFDWVMQSMTRNKVHVYVHSAIRKQVLMIHSQVWGWSAYEIFINKFN